MPEDQSARAGVRAPAMASMTTWSSAAALREEGERRGERTSVTNNDLVNILSWTCLRIFFSAVFFLPSKQRGEARVGLNSERC